MSEPLKHHYVPQVYLKGFGAGKGVIVYDATTRTLEDLKRQVRSPRIETRVEHLAAEIDYYTRETKDGPDYSFEQMLGKFENLYRPIMKAVRSGEPLSDEHLGYLSLLAAVQSARVNRMSLVEPMDKIRRQAAALYRQHRPELNDEQIVAETDRMVREQLMDTEVPSPRNIALEAVPQMIDFEFNMFRYMFKCVVYSDAHHFVTSDAPVVFIDPAQFPEPRWHFFRLSPFMEVTFPLSRRACLVMAWHPMQPQFHADEAMVATINGRTANYARRYVFAPNTGVEADRETTGRDFNSMVPWIGAPLTQAFMREGPTTEEEDARYQMSLAKLGVPLAMAQEEMKKLQSRYEEATQFFIELQMRMAREEAASLARKAEMA